MKKKHGLVWIHSCLSHIITNTLPLISLESRHNEPNSQMFEKHPQNKPSPTIRSKNWWNMINLLRDELRMLWSL